MDDDFVEVDVLELDEYSTHELQKKLTKQNFGC